MREVHFPHNTYLSYLSFKFEWCLPQYLGQLLALLFGEGLERPARPATIAGSEFERRFQRGNAVDSGHGSIGRDDARL
jgi:hypothetical protein